MGGIRKAETKEGHLDRIGLLDPIEPGIAGLQNVAALSDDPPIVLTRKSDPNQVGEFVACTATGQCPVDPVSPSVRSLEESPAFPTAQPFDSSVRNTSKNVADS